MIDTNNIRRQLLSLTRKSTNKRIDKLSSDVMDLCDAYDEIASLDSAIKLGNSSLQQSFDMIENLRKSL